MSKKYLEILFFSSIFICACAPSTSTIPSGEPIVVQEWQPTPYEPCKVNPIAHPNDDLLVTTHHYDLPYGRYDALASMRPVALYKQGKEVDVGSPIIERFGNEGSQRIAWKGNTIYLNKLYEDPQHAMYEEATGNLSLYPPYYRADVYSLDTSSGQYVNLTSDSLSFYNLNAFIMPNNTLAFSAIIDQVSKIYTMSINGSDKRPLTGSSEFSYGFSVSPDGNCYAYHAEYHVYTKCVLGAEREATTGNAFNFMPVWSPDSKYVAFFSGNSSATANIYVADFDGSNVRLVANRVNFNGSVPFTNQYDFHGGGSDNLAWHESSVIYASAPDGEVDLYMTGIEDGKTTKLTHGGVNNFPVSTDSTLYYVKRSADKSDLYSLKYKNGVETKLSETEHGCGIRYPVVRQ